MGSWIPPPFTYLISLGRKMRGGLLPPLPGIDMAKPQGTLSSVNGLEGRTGPGRRHRGASTASQTWYMDGQDGLVVVVMRIRIKGPQ